jgi:hypothetical protein
MNSNSSFIKIIGTYKSRKTTSKMAVKSEQPRRAVEECEVKWTLVQVLCDSINCCGTGLCSLQAVSQTICRMNRCRKKVKT